MTRIKFMESTNNQLAVIQNNLAPFLEGTELSATQMEQVNAHLELLLKWNAQINLTSVREPEAILARHFGESFFAARVLLGEGNASAGKAKPKTAIDLGSGAGFPGIPLAIYAAEIKITLIEAHNKKVTFLKESVRALKLQNVEVFDGRAEQCNFKTDIVMMRAVEKFAQSMMTGARLVGPGGRLVLLTGKEHVAEAKMMLPMFKWQDAIAIPQSEARVVLVGVA